MDHNIDENETKSIDQYHQYRSIDPQTIEPGDALMAQT
jgi:hypothetical protein